MNSHLFCAALTTTGNKSKRSFDALTVEEGGRRMEMEKDEKWRKHSSVLPSERHSQCYFPPRGGVESKGGGEEGSEEGKEVGWC